MKRYVMAGLGIMFLGVVSTVHAEMEVKVKDNTANNGFSIKEETTGSTIARFRGDGKVGIGTTNPLSGYSSSYTGLEVAGDIAVIRVRDNNADGAAAAEYIEFYDSNSRQGVIGFNRENDNNLYVENEDGGNVIIKNGNVGIGTTNPDAMLTVGNYTSSGRIKVNTSDVGLIVKSVNPQAPSNEAQILSGNLIKDTYAVGDKVSIVLGMTDLPGGLSSHIEAIAEDVNVSTRKCGLRVLTTNFENDGVKERMRIAGNGNVGIGIANPAYNLDVNGTIRGSNVSPSDVRWKEHVKTLDNSLDKVNKLRGVSFQWKDKAKGIGKQIGLIAQEVEKIFPEVVSEDNEGYKSVAYDKLVGVLVEAIKEQQGQIEELKKSNESLRQEIDSIKTFMSTYAQLVTMPVSAEMR